MTTDQPIHDVIQIGYGPVGQTSAALLGRAGHDVAVFERHSGLYALPRAGHVDHEIMRVFQSAGAVEPMLEDLFRCSTYGWRNQHGETLLDIDWSKDGISGWASDYLMYQPYVEDALDKAVRRQPTVSVRHGWEALDVVENEDHVAVTLSRGRIEEGGRYVLTDERETVRGRYLIGADGANSFTRTKAGIGLDDLGFREQWLVVDFREKRPLSFDFDNGQICDPARPLCLFQLGKTHRRFEFMVMPGEDPVALAGADSVWSLVERWVTPDDVDLIRSTVYTFRSANAHDWRKGRVLIVGDAAHTMPPFLGQGMCSGIRDVANLSWKLDLVLRGVASDDLLDSYTVERKPHVADIIHQAVALGKVSCTIDPAEARRRDAAFMIGSVPPPPPFPWIQDGVVDENAFGVEGRLGPQATVEVDGRRGRADDVVGGGWQLICRAGVPEAISGASRDVLDALHVRTLEIDAPGGVIDVEGAYGRYLDDHGIDAVVVRPDFYVFGAAGAGTSPDGLIGRLAGRLDLRLPAGTAAAA